MPKRKNFWKKFLGDFLTGTARSGLQQDQLNREFGQLSNQTDHFRTQAEQMIAQTKINCESSPDHQWNPATNTCELIPTPPVLGSTNIGINPTAIRIPDVKPRVARRIS